MARIFITGSADGLGLLAAKALIASGHQVVLHARNEKRGSEAIQKAEGAENILLADLSDVDETIALAEKINSVGKFDALIHNAGLYNDATKDMVHVNTFAPYILTCLVQNPQRHIYLSSDMHRSGHFNAGSFPAKLNYSDTKLHVLMLCKSVARLRPHAFANAVNPGWVPTKMGGAAAPDDLQKGYETQVWLATSEDEKAKVSGRYFFHQKEVNYNTEADNTSLQDELLKVCEKFTGVEIIS
jgi:NAD(P)-dependent dehydrogenase (short-subunit alcohol dehydrogenase family)